MTSTKERKLDLLIKIEDFLKPNTFGNDSPKWNHLEAGLNKLTVNELDTLHIMLMCRLDPQTTALEQAAREAHAALVKATRATLSAVECEVIIEELGKALLNYTTRRKIDLDSAIEGGQ